jgi:hypothetical protein
VEDVQTNEFINNALGNGAYSLQWIGAKCTLQSGQWRYRWAKDLQLLAAGYTNFPVSDDDYYPSEQEINPCNKVR